MPEMGASVDRKVEQRAEVPPRRAPAAAIPLSPALGAARAGAVGNAAVARLAQGSAAERGRLGRLLRPGSASAGLIQRDDSPGAAAAPAAPAELYNIKLTDGEHNNLSKQDAIAVLADVARKFRSAYEFAFNEWAIVNKQRTSFWGAIGGSISDLAGKEFPDYGTTWGPAYNELVAAERAVRAGDVVA